MAIFVALAVCLVACLGCHVQSEVSARQQWEGILLSPLGHSARTEYDNVRYFDGTTRIDGYRLWRGSYRGVPLEVYSCVLQQPYVTFSGGGVKYVSLVLTAWPADGEKGGTILAERRYPVAEIHTAELVRDPAVRPKYVQDVAAGRLRVEVTDRGDGRLAVQINALATPETHLFNLEELLAEWPLREGAREIVSDGPPDWTREQFVEGMLQRMAEFDTTTVRWWQGHPTPREIRALDHPLWRDARAVQMLLQKASPGPLVHTLKFMRLLNHWDPFYLTSLEGLENDLVSMGSHPDEHVRAAFAKLLFWSPHWPADLELVGPLLDSDDANVQAAVLAIHHKRGKQPDDLGRVRQLTGSQHRTAAYWAKQVLKLSE